MPNSSDTISITSKPQFTVSGAGGSSGGSGGVGGEAIKIPAKASFTRPADSVGYVSGDLVANNTTAASVTPLSWTGVTVGGTGVGGSGTIHKVVVAKAGAVATTLRVHFFKTAPTFAFGDNGALSVSNFNADNYLGFADVVLDTGANGGAMGQASDVNIPFVLAGTDTIYGAIECRQAFTPLSGGSHDVTISVGAVS
jgi:hypothetical protein